MYTKKLVISIVSLTACLFGQIAFGNMTIAQVKSSDVQAFNLQPRFTAWGFTGNRTSTEGQMLVPFYGDSTRAFYGILEGGIVAKESNWDSGAGFGYRQVVADRIYGGYAIMNYDSTPHVGFWVANPGLEMLGKVWDINVNGYIPLESKKKSGNEYWASGDNENDSPYVIRQGNNVWNRLFQDYEEPGRGFDFEVGRVVPYFEGTKIYAGAYHFDTSDSGSVNGIETRLVFEMNKYTALQVEDNYDNVKHNQAMVGIRFSLGGYSKEEKDAIGISSRLLDPIDHDFATLQSSISTMRKVSKDDGEALQHDDAWYFKSIPSTTASVNDPGPVQEGEGTYENPFIGFTPSNYQVVYNNQHRKGVDAYPLMYFDGAKDGSNRTYTFSDFTFGEGDEYAFSLPYGWKMEGRTSNFSQVPYGNDRPEFYGQLRLEAGNNTVSGLRFYNSLAVDGAYQTVGIYMNNAQNVTLHNVSVGGPVESESDLFKTYPIGIEMNGSSVNLEGVDVYGYFAFYDLDFAKNHAELLPEADAIGVKAVNSTINFVSGNNIISSESIGYYSYPESMGISADASILNFTGGTNTIISNSIDDSPSDINAFSYGIYAFNASKVNFEAGNNTVDAIASSGMLPSEAYGIYAEGSTISFSGGANAINVSAYNSGEAIPITYGIYADSASNLINADVGHVTINRVLGTDGADIYWAGH